MIKPLQGESRIDFIKRCLSELKDNTDNNVAELYEKYSDIWEDSQKQTIDYKAMEKIRIAKNELLDEKAVILKQR